MHIQAKQWRRFTGEQIQQFIDAEVADAIAREKKMGHQVKVCIGTDSRVNGAGTEFATAIVVVRKGMGGFMYLNNETMRGKMSIRQRMLAEVSKSVEVAYFLSHVLSRHQIDMEVHIDINTNPVHKSNEALKDAIGYITGMGFAFKAKPEAFASTCCANKVV